MKKAFLILLSAVALHCSAQPHAATVREYCQAAMKKAPKLPIPGPLRETPGAGVGAHVLRAVEEAGME